MSHFLATSHAIQLLLWSCDMCLGALEPKHGRWSREKRWQSIPRTMGVNKYCAPELRWLWLLLLKAFVLKLSALKCCTLAMLSPLLISPRMAIKQIHHLCPTLLLYPLDNTRLPRQWRERRRTRGQGCWQEEEEGWKEQGCQDRRPTMWVKRNMQCPLPHPQLTP